MSGYNEAVREAAMEYAAETAHEMLSSGDFDEEIIEMILNGDFDNVVEDRTVVLMEDHRLDDQIKFYLDKILSDDIFELVVEQL